SLAWIALCPSSITARTNAQATSIGWGIISSWLAVIFPDTESLFITTPSSCNMHLVISEGARDHWTKCLRARQVSTDGVSAFSAMETVEHTRNGLLADLEAIQHLVTLTVARMNDLSITARLPAEVLMHIFDTLRDCDPPSSKPLLGDKLRPGEKRHLGWISSATHVCRRWRLMALAVPALWTRIGAPQTGPWMNEMLARSKQVPFTLSATITRDDKVCDTVIKAAGPDFIWRMKGLHLADERIKRPCYVFDDITEYGPLVEYRREVLRSLKHSAPMLESLTLDDVTKFETMPSQFFANETPRLRHFAIRECFKLQWDAPYLRGITDLELGLNHVYFSLAKLIALLQESPMLENLKIVGTSFATRTEDLPDGNASLPSLKAFYLDTTADTQCAEFLARLEIPSTAQKELVFRGCDAEQASRVLRLAAAFGYVAEGSSRPSPSEMRFRCDSSTISLRAQSKAEHGVEPGFLAIKWSSTASDPTAHRIAVAGQLFGSFDVRKVTYLSVAAAKLDDELDGVLEDFWFSRMSALKNLTLRGQGTKILFDLLETRNVYSRDAGTASIDAQVLEGWRGAPPFFPGLEFVFVGEVSFDEDTSRALIRAVKHRAALGKALPILRVNEGNGGRPPKAMLRKLSKYVGILRCPLQ
ncbi:hypothetical protein EWM64_g6805, partial [Hericium alpestre]